MAEHIKHKLRYCLALCLLAAISLLAYEVSIYFSRNPSDWSLNPIWWIAFTVFHATFTAHWPILTLIFVCALIILQGPSLRTLFLIGPLVLLIPLILWAAAWYLTLNGENQSWYITWPMLALVGIAGVWHIALIVLEKERRGRYLLYALVYLPLFYLAVGAALIPATHFPL